MTTWNNTAPAVGNQISADIPDVTENFAHIKSGLVRIFKTAWSDSDLTAHVCDSAVGWSDGTYTYDFPTNGIAGHSVIMLGNSSTVVWMYLNAAPPGWKALSTGADMVLGISGGASAYNVNGGNPDSAATWTQADHTLTEAEMPGHVHELDGRQWSSSGSTEATSFSEGTTGGAARDHDTKSTGDDGAHNHGATWRPKASVGKLFQLDTA